jgi:putative spermidine/putrescine transport system permease protein
MKRKPWAIVAVAFGALYFTLPLIGVFLFSLRGKKGALGFSAYARVFADPQFLKSFLFSFRISLATIAIGLALVLPTAMYVRLRLPRIRPYLEAITNLPFTVPVIVLAFGLIKLYGRPPIALVSSPLLLAAGSTVICLPYLYRTIDAGLEAIDLKSLTEASASLGASGFRTLFAVVLPNLRTAIVGAASIVFALVMGELTLAVMLAWPAFGPYMALVGRDLAYEPAALAVLSFILTWISIALFHAAGRALGGEAAKPPVA